MTDKEFIAKILGEMIDDKPEKGFREMAKEIGEGLKQAHLGYMDAGFTNEQAFELVMNAIKK